MGLVATANRHLVRGRLERPGYARVMEDTRQPRHAPLFALAVMGSLVSQNVGAAWAKSLFPLVGTEGVTALRVGLSALVLLALWRPWRTRIARRDGLNLIVYGGMLGLMNLLIYKAFERIPIGLAIAIEVTGPLTVVLLASRRPADFAWIACAVTGLALLLPIDARGGALDPVGVGFALGAAVCWAMYIMFGKRASALGGGQAVSVGMLVAALLTVPIGVAHSGAALASPVVLLAGLAVAVLSSALPYSLEMAALRRLPGRVFGILVSAAPAIGAVAGHVMLGERLTALQWGAVVCVMAASAGSAATASGAR
jgi:inner membrane transporter RhtA